MPQIQLFSIPALVHPSPAPLPHDQALLLLTHLAAHPHGRSRADLVHLLWPDEAEDLGRHKLRNLLYRNRSQPWHGWLEVSPQHLSLHASSDLQLFLQHYEKANWLEVVLLYQGPLLQGVDVSAFGLFEGWLHGQQQACQQMFRDALFQLSDTHKDLKRSRLKKWLEQEPLDEEALQALLKLCEPEQFSLVQPHVQRFELGLQQEGLGQSSPVTRQLVQGLQRAPALPAAKTAVLESPVLRNLPRPAGPLVGRASELKALQETLLLEGCRLLTLTGLGGTGKTRLVTELARQVAHHFADGVLFADLTQLQHPDRLVPLLADGLGLQLSGQASPLQQLAFHLGRRRMLLVLDNFEDVLAHSASQATEPLLALLEQAPGVKLLVTSRMALQVLPEWVFPLQGLPWEGTEAPASQLFWQAARKVQVFPSRQDGPLVEQLCQLSEGLPLALELMASSLRYLSLQEILEEMETPDPALLSYQDLPARQQSMGRVFEASWRHLSPAEQQVFAGLSVFRGGFTAEAAMQVAGATRQTLLMLQAKSLVRQEHNGRYSLHALLRQFASHKLQEQGNTQQVLQNHLRFHAGLLASAEPELKWARSTLPFDQYRSERDNILLAWHTLMASPTEALLGQMLEAQIVFVEANSREGHPELELFLPLAERLEALWGKDHPFALLARLTYHAIHNDAPPEEHLQHMRALLEAMRAHPEHPTLILRALRVTLQVMYDTELEVDPGPLMQELQDRLDRLPEEGPDRLYFQAMCAFQMGRFLADTRGVEHAVGHFEHLEHHLEARGMLLGLAEVLICHADLLNFRLGEHPLQEYRRALQIFQQFGSHFNAGSCANNLAMRNHPSMTLEDSEQMMRAAIRAVGHTYSPLLLSILQGNLATLLSRMGREPEARQEARTCLEICQQFAPEAMLNPNMLIKAAYCAWKLQRPSDLHYLRRSLEKVVPQGSVAYGLSLVNNIGQAALENGDLPLAHQFLNSYMVHPRANPEVFKTRPAILRQLETQLQEKGEPIPEPLDLEVALQKILDLLPH